MKSLLYIPFLCLALASAAQEVRFNNVYDYGGSEVIRGIKMVNSGYLAVCELYQAGSYKILISKLSLDGQKLWDRKYLLDPAGHSIGLNSLTEDANGNYWICGWINIGLDSSHAYAFSFSGEGDSLWFIRDTTALQSISGVIPKSNGNIVVTGFDRVAGSNAKVMLAEWDSAGNVLWKKVYYQTPGLVSVGWHVAQTPDSGYIIGASIGEGLDADPRVIKTDSQGNFQWERVFDHSQWGESGASVLVSSDSFIYAGSSATKEQITSSIYLCKGFLAKLDLNNQLIWSREYGKPLNGDGFAQIKEDRAGNILAVTQSEELNDSLGIFHGWLLKVNPEGDSLWEKRYRFNYDTTLDCRNYAWSLDTTIDGAIVSAGFVQCDDTGASVQFQDLWVVKFDSNGCFDTVFDCTVDIEELPDYKPEALKIWPNPNDGVFFLDVKDLSEYEIQVFDIHGSPIPYKIHGHRSLSVKGVPIGLYFVVLNKGTSFKNQRFIISTP